MEPARQLPPIARAGFTDSGAGVRSPCRFVSHRIVV